MATCCLYRRSLRRMMRGCRRAKAPDPEGAGDERRQHDERLQEEGDKVVGKLTFVFKPVDAEEGSDVRDEPVGPRGQRYDDGEAF